LYNEDPNINGETPVTGNNSGVNTNVLSAIASTERARSSRSAAGGQQNRDAGTPAGSGKASGAPGGRIPYEQRALRQPAGSSRTQSDAPSNGKTGTEQSRRDPGSTTVQSSSTGKQTRTGAGNNNSNADKFGHTENRRASRSAGSGAAAGKASGTAAAHRFKTADDAVAEAEHSAREAARKQAADAERASREAARKEAAEADRAAKARAAKEAEEAGKAAREQRARERELKEKLRLERADLRRAERRERNEKISAAFSSVFAVCKDYYKYFFIFTTAILLVIAMLCGASLLLFCGRKDYSGLTEKIVYTVGDKTVRKQSATELIRNGIVYTDMTSVAKMCGMSVSGDSSTVRFTSAEGEYAVVEDGSVIAVLNGSRFEMQGKAVIGKSAVLLPLSFVEQCVTGVTVSYTHEHDEETGENGEPLPEGLINSISIKRSIDETGSVTAAGFILKSTGTLNSVPKDSIPSGWLLIGDDNIAYTYLTDLSSYQKYMNPSDKKKYITLINANNKVDQSYIPEDMISVLNVKSGKNLTLDRNAEKSLEAMFTEMAAEGLTDIYVNRAYVSYSVQKSSFDTAYYNERYYYKNNFEKTGKYFSDTAYRILGKSYIENVYISTTIYHLTDSDARTVASSYCAVPGSSDHQSGLGVDIWGKDGDTAFVKSDAYKWLKENAYKFGFIERYPSGKEKVTGFAAESYHWRFVGQYHAAVMHDYGFCLEEYVAYISEGRQ